MTLPWRPTAVALALTVASAGACDSNTSTTATASPGTDAGTGAPDGAATARPAHAPAGIRFADTDAACASVAGAVGIQKAGDESDVDSYAVYWGSSTGVKLDPKPIAVLPKTGGDLTFVLPTTHLPAAARYLLAFSSNATGEMTSGASTPILERVVFADISAGLGSTQGSTWAPTAAVLDAKNEKLLVVGGNELFRCNLDGTGCTHTAIGSGALWSMVIDTVNDKLLVTERGFDRPLLARCNLDGTGCSEIDISAGQVGSTDLNPSAAIDSKNGKLLVVSNMETNAERLGLFRCSLDGTGCAYSDISAGFGRGSAAVVLDESNGKMLAATASWDAPHKAVIHRANVDGTGAAYVALDELGAGSTPNPSIIVDSPRNELLIAASAGIQDGQVLRDRPTLFRCKVDATGCSSVDLTAGFGLGDAMITGERNAVIDSVHDELLVAGSWNRGPALFRCNRDGTACVNVDISAGMDWTAPYISALPTAALLDAPHGKLLVVLDIAHGYFPGNTPGLALVCLQ